MKRTKRLLALMLSMIFVLSAAPAVTAVTTMTDDGGITQIFAPHDLAVQAGNNATFSLTIQSGAAPYAYRWETATSEDGPWNNIPGGGGNTSDMTFSVTLTAVTVGMNGTYYRCIVTDSATPVQSLTSSVAQLQVVTASTQCATPTANAFNPNNSTVGINQGIRINSTVAWNQNPRIYYEAGAGPETNVPNPNRGSNLYTKAITIPPTLTHGQTYVIKAIATSSNALDSNVLTLTYTVDRENAYLTDIKHEPAFLQWKANNFKGSAPQVVKDKIDAVVARMSTREKVAMTLGRSLTTTGITGISNATLLPGDACSSVGFLKYGITQTSLSDGPAGIRITVGEGSNPYQRNATGWPNGTARAATWNTELNEKMGDAWGREISWFGGDLLLAPGMDIHRSVLGGRNFEYYSEDPLLTGLTAAHETIGIQKNNIGVNAKHYAMNSQEYGRHGGYNNVADTRAIREIYLRGYEYLVGVGKPWSLMSSYPRINGVSAMQSHDLMNQIPRNEWGFEGFIVTDWNELGEYTDRRAYPQLANNEVRSALGFNTNYTANSGPDHVTRLQAGPLIIAAGNELIMPGNNGGNQVTAIENALANSSHPLTIEIIDRAVTRMLEHFVCRSTQFNDGLASFGAMPQELKDANRAVGREVGDESVVLIKNEAVNGKPTLPLNKNMPGKVLSLGNLAQQLIIGGGGSGIVQLSAADTSAIPSLNAAMITEMGGDSSKLINTASMGFQNVNSVPVAAAFSGQPARQEMVVPAANWNTWGQDNTIEAITYVIGRNSGEGVDVPLGQASNPTSGTTGGYYVSGAEKNIIDRAAQLADELGVPFIIMLNAGNWIRMSEWADKADAILMIWQQCMGGGTPAARVLFGTVNPSGKATTSVPIDIYGDAENGALLNPSEGQFRHVNNADRTPGALFDRYSTSFFYEGIYLGYRYYDTFNVPVSVPFGHGLSYTTFGYSNAALEKTTFNGKDDKLKASVTITNTGAVAGKEVVQLYIGAPGIQMPKPVKELKGYAKTRLLSPNESQTFEFEIDAKDLASYSNSGATDGSWLVEEGHYVVYFASSSQDIRTTKSFVVPAGFTTRTVDAGALSPIGSSEWDRANAVNLETNALKPTQIVVTFKPMAGAPEGESFKKAYSVMGSTYGYLPELISGYTWFDEGAGAYVNECTVVTSGDKTLIVRRSPIELSINGNGEVNASVTYMNDVSATPVKGQLILALYDDGGRLVAVKNVSTQQPAAVGMPFSLNVSLPLTEGAVLAKGFLWDDDSYKPFLESESFAIN